MPWLDRTACGFADKNKGKDICFVSRNWINYVQELSVFRRELYTIVQKAFDNGVWLYIIYH